MSIFTSTLAFQSDALQVISKVSVMGGSLIAGIIGFCYLYRLKNTADIKLEHPPKKTHSFTFTKGLATVNQ